MQLKTRILMPFLAAALMIGLSSSAFAQLSCGVASTPVSRDTITGLTEVAGDLIFGCLPGPTATTGATITVSYAGLPITDSTAYPAAKPISVVSPSGGFTGGGLPTISGVNNATGQITISVPAQAVPAASGFTLTGVLLALTGTTSGSGINATVSVSPGNGLLITAGQNVATVITSIQSGIKDPVITKNFTAGQVLTSGVIVNAGWSVDITEAYQDMYRTALQFDTIGALSGASQDTEVLLTFTGIPTGITLGGCTVVDVDASGTPYATMTISATSITSTANTILVDFAPSGVGVDLVNIDTVRFACTTFAVGSTAAALTPTTVTMTASLAPTGTALSSGGAALTTATTGQIPRYTALQQPATPLPVFQIIPAATNMLIPFAEVVGTYDTGIALANTTTDPFGAKTGGAVQTSGPVTFSIYPQYVNGATTQQTACTVTTATGSTTPASLTSIPGQGLDSTGVLRTGSTWTVNLSNILSAAPASAGCPSATNFIGYVFIVANSVEVHGTAFVYNNGNFTSYTNVLVLPPPTITTRANPAGGVEALGN